MKHNLFQKTDVVILCGGLGTRLKGVLDDRPKPMVEINGKPFLDILIDYVAQFGLVNFILCIGYKGDYIKKNYEDKKDLIKFIFSEEKEPLGTAGAIKHAESFIKSDPFIVINGDSFCKVDLEDFFCFHIEKKAIISIVITSIEDCKDYGLIQLDKDDKVIRFSEKHSAGNIGLINAGIYIFNREVLREIPPLKKQSLEYELIPKILNKGVYGYRISTPLIDIGTPERLEKAKKYFGRLTHEK